MKHRLGVRLAAMSWGIALLLGGCGILDYSLLPRTYTVNEAADAVLNNSILLNIVRAGNSEPLNFVAISKYTGSAQLTASSGIGQWGYAPEQIHPTKTFGPNTIGAQATGSFDLNVLETKDFYTGLLREMEPGLLESWFKQGLSRSLVFHVLLRSVRVTMAGLVYEYRNDPTDDKWTDNRGVELRSGKCNEANYNAERSIWVGNHADDCRFHKFRYLIGMAVKYGLRLEVIMIDNPKYVPPKKGEDAKEPKKISKTQTCYDPSVVREQKRGDRSFVKLFFLCSSEKPNNAKTPIHLKAIDIEDVELISRSPFAIFQYLGKILASSGMDRVTVSDPDDPVQQDSRLLTVLISGGPDCFAQAWYRGAFYCVPTEAENTKRVFTMLRAMIATNTSAFELNATPTIRVTP